MRPRVTDEERDRIYLLHTRGIKADDISDIMHHSKSSVCLIIQTAEACQNEDWYTLNRLYKSCQKNVEWACRAFHKTLPSEVPSTPEPELPQSVDDGYKDYITSMLADYFESMLTETKQVKELLQGILDTLK